LKQGIISKRMFSRFQNNEYIPQTSLWLCYTPPSKPFRNYW
jgi:hypothetical protein